MGQFLKNKITVLCLVFSVCVCFVWYKCKNDEKRKIECKELIFFRFNLSLPKSRPVSYQTILYRKEGSIIRQVSYYGEIRVVDIDLLNCRFFPDSAMFGHKWCADKYFGYIRESYFYKYKFKTDTLSLFHFLDEPIYLKNHDTSEYQNYQISFERDITDTIFNHIYQARNCKKYIIYSIGIHSSMYVDMDKYIMIQFDNTSNDNWIDSYSCTYRIVQEKDISESYFEEMWNKSEQVDQLNFDLSTCGR